MSSRAWKLRLIFAVIFGTPVLAGAQQPPLQPAAPPLLTIQERDEDGGTRTISPGPGISDIMSDLRIQIDRDALRSRVAEQEKDRLPVDLKERLSGLQAALSKRKDSLSKLASVLDEWEKVRAAGGATPPQQFIKALSEAASPLNEVLNNPALGRRLRARIEERLNIAIPASVAEQYALIYDAIADELRSVEEELNTFARENGISVQMGAWIATANEQRPIHLPGFDEYPEGEDFIIERWDIALNESEQKQLEALASQAKELNQKSNLALALWQANGASLIEAALSNSTTLECANDLQKKTEELKDQVESTQQDLRNSLESLKNQLRDFQQVLQDLQTKYGLGAGASGKSPAEFLIGTSQDLSALVQRTTTLFTTLQDQARTLTGLAASATGSIKTGLENLAGQARSCAGTAATEAQNWRQSLMDRVAMLRAGRPLDMAAFQFGEEVTKLTLAQVPAETSFPLRKTGERAAGDSIVVKIALFNANGSGGGTGHELESHRILLYRILPHVERTVGLIFADPNGETKVTNKFQAAPGYSLLLKGWGDKELRRKSVAYNQLVDFGFGLNISALDFNKDDTPELGVGFVLSIFRDILQAGVGYDVNEAEQYWFFGIRVPMPTR